MERISCKSLLESNGRLLPLPPAQNTAAKLNIAKADGAIE